jgi:hypothetical protein
MSMVLTGFGEFKSKEDYWKDSKVQKQFSNSYGSEAKMRFDQAYDNSKRVCQLSARTISKISNRARAY